MLQEKSDSSCASLTIGETCGDVTEFAETNASDDVSDAIRSTRVGDNYKLRNYASHQVSAARHQQQMMTSLPRSFDVTSDSDISSSKVNQSWTWGRTTIASSTFEPINPPPTDQSLCSATPLTSRSRHRLLTKPETTSFWRDVTRSRTFEDRFSVRVEKRRRSNTFSRFSTPKATYL